MSKEGWSIDLDEEHPFFCFECSDQLERLFDDVITEDMETAI